MNTPTSPQEQRSVCGASPLPLASRKSLLHPLPRPLMVLRLESLLLFPGVHAAGPPSLQWEQARLTCTEAADNPLRNPCAPRVAPQETL